MRPIHDHRPPIRRLLRHYYRLAEHRWQGAALSHDIEAFPGRQAPWIAEMTLKLYNTLTRTKEEFRPLDPNNVRMYVCGPTVYDYAHIGNARPVIVFDVLFRLLRHLYGPDHVTYVRNITDIDDKINARAREEGVPIRELTERTAKQFHEDIQALGVLQPTYEPRATESIPEMISMIEKLIARGCAYVAEAHVLFSVSSMNDYGRLSKRSLDEMIAGARVDVAPYKRDPMDFVLWKPSDAETPGWDSPWGRGRPGWHIECSAMADKWLWEKALPTLTSEGRSRPHQFDLHGGGIDLIFPHHENELAQTKCAFGHDIMANIWMHNGFLQIEGHKMSKSLGNFVTIRELLNTNKFGGRKWPGEVLRFTMLKTHYRQPIDWTVRSLEEALTNLRDLRATWEFENSEADENEGGELDTEFLRAIKDDLNTVRAIGLLLEGSSDLRRTNLEVLLSLLGIDLARFDAQERRTVALSKKKEELVRNRISVRLAARKNKNWAESDRIRDELASMGVVLHDNKDGTTTWEVKR